MKEEERKIRNCFDVFEDVSPKRKDPTIQVLYDYEKHYMELIRRYIMAQLSRQKSEIFIMN